MAAFTVFCAGALTIGAEFAAVVFASLGYALALFNFAIALRMSTFFGHDCYLLTRYLTLKEAVIVPWQRPAANYRLLQFW
jgi:hypothetical protein